MPRLIKILHIDPDYQTTYLIYRSRSSIRTTIPLGIAIKMLKSEEFDLVISEPHNRAILKNTDPLETANPEVCGKTSFGGR